MKRRFGLTLTVLLASSAVVWGSQSRARNVILCIGDGLGPAPTALAIQYARRIEGRKLHLDRLMELGNTGYALPLSHGVSVVDSAASASQIASGVEARNETLGVDVEGNPVETLLEWAESRGMATGLITNTRISHATPAAFAAHQLSRYSGEDDLATQIVAGHEIEVLLGGGARALIPQGRRVSEVMSGLPLPLDGSSVRRDGRNLLEEARGRGYTVVSERAALRTASASARRLLGAFASSHLPYVVDRRSEALDGVPDLAELARAALTVLARAEKGFFLMLEGGRIDHAAHDNDAGTMLHELLEFDEALGVALAFQAEHPETLLVVTGDHGTGGFSFTYSRGRKESEVRLASGAVYSPRWYYPDLSDLRRLGQQTASFERILDRAGTDPVKVGEEVRRATGLELTPSELAMIVARDERGLAHPHDFSEFYADDESTPQCLIGRALARQTQVVWSTGGHTVEPIFTYGVGPGAEGLRGLYLSTRLHSLMKQALGGESRP
jgi:alkaline phosphatase